MEKMMKQGEPVFRRTRREHFKKELKRIVDRIAEGYAPEKIILFGSLVKEDVQQVSDIDLIIIKVTTEDAWERAAKVDRLLDHKVPVDILIYTPQEIEWRLAINDDFVKEFNKRGEVIYNG